MHFARSCCAAARWSLLCWSPGGHGECSWIQAQHAWPDWGAPRLPLTRGLWASPVLFSASNAWLRSSAWKNNKGCPIILCSGHFWVVPSRAMGGLREEILLVLDHIISAALADSRMSRVMLSRLSRYSFSRSLNLRGCQSNRISSNTWKWLNLGGKTQEQAFLLTDSHISSSCSYWGQTEWKINTCFIKGLCQNIFHTNVSRPEPGHLQLQIHLLLSCYYVNTRANTEKQGGIRWLSGYFEVRWRVRVQKGRRSSWVMIAS